MTEASILRRDSALLGDAASSAVRASAQTSRFSDVSAPTAGPRVVPAASITRLICLHHVQYVIWELEAKRVEEHTILVQQHSVGHRQLLMELQKTCFCE